MVRHALLALFALTIVGGILAAISTGIYPSIDTLIGALR